jgi:hypothetical protein
MPLRLPHQEFSDGNMATGSFRFIDYTPASSTGADLRDLKTARSRHPASRDTCTSLCIDYCLDATLYTGHPVSDRTIKAGDQSPRPPPAVFDGLRL